MPRSDRPVPRWRGAMAGLVAAGVALAAGELVTAVHPAGPSLVSAVGSAFIDRFAASLKDVAVSLFGTNDKAALLTGIVLASLLLGAVAGVGARRRPWVAVVVFVAFGVLGLSAYLDAPGSSLAVGVVAAGVGVAAGLATLHLLLRAPTRPGAVDGVTDASGDLAAAPRAEVIDARATSRRAFLVRGAAMGAGAVGMAVVARRLGASDAGEAARRRAVLPRPVSRRPVPAGQPFEVPGLSPYVTPTPDFYRIDTALTVPSVGVEGWRLDVTGRVDRPLSLSYDELLALPSVEEVVTLQCVSNEVGGDLVGNAVWQGVPLAALLERAGVQPGATQVVGRSVDRWTAGFPTEVVADGRVALVAYGMNGEPLPVRHGFPARLVVAGLYGYVSATKWLREIELTTWEAVDGYWVPRGWSKQGPIKTMSRIDVPAVGRTVPAGPTALAGVAWAPTRGIRAVEVQVDDGPWNAGELGRVASDATWVQWRYDWSAVAGDHVVRVRAVDGTGTVQTGEVRRPDPDGATGWHTRRVRVVA